jgi:hypothetical protein
MPIQTARNESGVMPPGSSISHRAPRLPPKTEQEHRYEDVGMKTFRNNFGSGEATTEEGELYAVYEYTLPGRFP